MTTSQISTSHSSSSPSLAQSWHISDDDLAALDPDQLLERITYAKAQANHYTALLASYLDALDQMVQNDQIETDITYNDWHIYRQPGRKTYSFPDSIKRQEADLKQSKELAIALGDATVKQGSPFWTLKFEG